MKIFYPILLSLAMLIPFSPVGQQLWSDSCQLFDHLVTQSNLWSVQAQQQYTKQKDQLTQTKQLMAQDLNLWVSTWQQSLVHGWQEGQQTLADKANAVEQGVNQWTGSLPNLSDLSEVFDNNEYDKLNSWVSNQPTPPADSPLDTTSHHK